ncbi:hypothetical protein LZ31DRAFT_561311 [Colletotrichum somersetense]|nr:hypothetical protein LZ31DRAFT_561311 [Colletotrichum somersetense]
MNDEHERPSVRSGPLRLRWDKAHIILVLIITFTLAYYFPQFDPSRGREGAKGGAFMQPVFVYAN